MSPRRAQRLLPVDDPGPHARVLALSEGSQICGQADEDFLCGVCAAVLCVCVRPSSFAPDLHVRCWGCQNVLSLSKPGPARTRMTPEDELRAARSVAGEAYRDARRKDPARSMSDLFCVVMNAGERLGARGTMRLLMGKGQSFEDARRAAKRELLKTADPLLATTVDFQGLRVLFEAARDPGGSGAEEAWFERPAGHDDLRVVLFSTDLRTFTITGAPPAPPGGSVDPRTLN